MTYEAAWSQRFASGDLEKQKQKCGHIIRVKTEKMSICQLGKKKVNGSRKVLEKKHCGSNEDAVFQCNCREKGK